MKKYSESKLRLTINLFILVVVVPIFINLLFRLFDKELYNQFYIGIHILFILIGVTAFTQYYAKIEISDNEIARKSPLGSIIFK